MRLFQRRRNLHDPPLPEIRQNHINEKPADRRNAVQGKVLDIAYLGNMSTYHVEMANGQIIKAQAANQRRRASLPFTWEDKVWLSWTDTAGVVLEG